MKRTLSLIIIVCWVFAACQATPEKEVVVNKANGEFQEKVESTEISTSENKSTSEVVADTDRVWKTNFQKGKVYINIDADIEIPDVKAYPILSVTPIEMNQEWADKALDVFFQGAMPYERVMTKQAIETKILIYRKVMEQIKAGNYTGGFSDEDYGLFEGEIDVLLDIHETAPNDNELIPSDAVFKEVDNGFITLQKLSVMGKVNKPSYADLIIMNNSTTKLNYIQFYNYDNNDIGPITSITEYSKEKHLKGISITREEAQKVSDGVITEMGIMGAELKDVNTVNIFKVKSRHNQEDIESDEQAFEFIYKKTYNGIDVSHFISQMKILQTEEGSKADSEVYSAVLEPEKLSITVDDSGVIFFDWKNPTYSDGLISENVELLDFEKIKEIFSSQIFYHQFYQGSEGSLDIYIDKIVLSYFIEPVINSNDEYIAIPVWDFINEGSGTYNSGQASTYLTINAIDGSVINRDLGY